MNQERAPARRSRLRKWAIPAVTMGLILALDAATPMQLGSQSGMSPLNPLEFMHRTLPIPILLPEIVFLALGDCRTARVLTLYCVGSVLSFTVISLWLKGAANLDDSRQLPTSTQQFFLFVATLLGAIHLLMIILVPFALVAAVVVFGAALGATWELAGKGYRFGLRERGILMMHVGGAALKQLPPREELAVLPGYGEGTGRDVELLIYWVDALR
ncbi:hypothetical protein BH09SUM1_BH09SUM1_19080 [soil metagenome]